MKKRIFAFLLTALTIASLAACNKDDDKKSEGSSTGSNDTASTVSTVDYEQDENIKKTIEDNVPMDQFSSKTKSVIEKFSSKDLKVELSMKIDKPKSDTSNSGSSLSTLAMLQGSELKFGFAKNGNNDMRISVDLGIMTTFDMLKNSDGLYYLNTKNKSAILTKIDEQNSAVAAESEASSSEDGSGSLLDSIDVGSIAQSTGLSADSFVHGQDGEEDFNGEKCSYESYTIKVPESSEANAKTEDITFKAYFSGDDLKGLQFSKDEEKFDIVVNTFDTKVDESEFKVPSEYTVTEDKDGTMMGQLFGGLLGGMGGNVLGE